MYTTVLTHKYAAMTHSQVLVESGVRKLNTSGTERFGLNVIIEMPVVM